MFPDHPPRSLGWCSRFLTGVNVISISRLEIYGYTGSCMPNSKSLAVDSVVNLICVSPDSDGWSLTALRKFFFANFQGSSFLFSWLIEQGIPMAHIYGLNTLLVYKMCLEGVWSSEGRESRSHLGLETKGLQTLGLVSVLYKILELVSSRRKIFGTVSSRSRLVGIIFT